MSKIIEEQLRSKFQIVKGAVPIPLRKILFCDDAVTHSIDRQMNTILDVGGGEGKIIRDVRRFMDCYAVNADIFLPYLKFSKAKGRYDDYVLCDARYLPIKPKAFSMCMCLHVIEHLQKEAGLKLIEQLEVIARKRVILTTPVGFHLIHEYDNNPHQVHKSGWTPNELKKKGFKVRGATGLRLLRGARSSSIFSNMILKFINFLATYLSQLLTSNHPSLAWEMVCIRNLKNSE